MFAIYPGTTVQGGFPHRFLDRDLKFECKGHAGGDSDLCVFCVEGVVNIKQHVNKVSLYFFFGHAIFNQSFSCR
jgi:hypothetical protein